MRGSPGRGLSTGTPRPGPRRGDTDPGVEPTPTPGTPPPWEFRPGTAGSSVPAGSEAAPPPSAHSMNVHNHPGPTPGHHAPPPPRGPPAAGSPAGCGRGSAGVPAGPDGTCAPCRAMAPRVPGELGGPGPSRRRPRRRHLLPRTHQPGRAGGRAPHRACAVPARPLRAHGAGAEGAQREGRERLRLREGSAGSGAGTALRASPARG